MFSFWRRYRFQNVWHVLHSSLVWENWFFVLQCNSSTFHIAVVDVLQAKSLDRGRSFSFLSFYLYNLIQWTISALFALPDWGSCTFFPFSNPAHLPSPRQMYFTWFILRENSRIFKAIANWRLLHSHKISICSAILSIPHPCDVPLLTSTSFYFSRYLALLRIRRFSFFAWWVRRKSV